MEESNIYTLCIDVDGRGTKTLYTILRRALETWPGGHPDEQEMLKNLTDNAYKCMMNAILDGDLG
jgi:hypothetical protein